MEKMYIFWNTYLDYLDELKNKIKILNKKYDYVVGIGRGGAIIGIIISYKLNIPYVYIPVSRYTNIGKTDTLSIGNFSKEIRGNILLVDDIIDEGITMQNVINNILTKSIDCVIEIYVMFYRKYRDCKFFESNVLYYTNLVKDNKWILFPYEVDNSNI